MWPVLAWGCPGLDQREAPASVPEPSLVDSVVRLFGSFHLPGLRFAAAPATHHPLRLRCGPTLLESVRAPATHHPPGLRFAAAPATQAQCLFQKAPANRSGLPPSAAERAPFRAARGGRTAPGIRFATETLPPRP